MSRPNEHNGQGALKLDEFFKEMLARVRPYIFRLSSAENAQLCKLWLNKLSTATSQRWLRNQYLVELCSQLKTGNIGGIFNTSPPDGLLLPLPKSDHMICVSSSLSDLSDCPVRPCRGWFKQNANYTQCQRSRTLGKHQRADSRPTVRFYDECRPPREQFQICRKHETDALSVLAGELRTENSYLKCKLRECQRNANERTNNLRENIRELSIELKTLKEELEEVRKAKEFEDLISGETEIADPKCQSDLGYSKNKTVSGKVTAVTEDEAFEETMHGKDKEFNDKGTKEHWMDKLKMVCQRYDTLLAEKGKELRIKEDLLEKNDADRRREIVFLTHKVHDLEAKLETKIKQEGKLQVTLTEQYATMKKEFGRMRSEIENATEKQNEYLASKVAVLKRVVVKLEKSKEKLGQEYERKLLQVVKNKDLEIRGLQWKLQGQKNELCTSFSSEKQCELNGLVSLLEEQYRSLLAEAKQAAEHQSREYLKRIAELEDQVLFLSKTRE